MTRGGTATAARAGRAARRAQRTDPALAGPSGGVHKAGDKPNILQVAARAASAVLGQQVAAPTPAVKSEEVEGEDMQINISCDGETRSKQQQQQQQREPLGAMSEDTDLEQPEVSVINRPSARVSFKYSNLPRKSKEKVQELLFTWLEWHRANFDPEDGDGANILSGEMEVSTSLQGTSGERVWMDRPRDAHTPAEPSTKSYEAQYSSLHKVPLYDRGCHLFSDYSPTPGPGTEPRSMNRCFNCGSYFHGIQQCNEPMNFTKIAENKAASGVGGGRGVGGGWGANQRYFEEGSTGEFKGLQPGVLSAETREALGIREHSPPPWFQRMRVLGSPPGWKDGFRQAGEDAESDNTFVIDDGDGIEQSIELEDNSSKGAPVLFPGISASVPSQQEPGAREWGVALSTRPLPMDHEFSAKYASLVSGETQDGSSPGAPAVGPRPMTGHAVPPHPVVNPPPPLAPPRQQSGFYYAQQYYSGHQHPILGAGMPQQGHMDPPQHHAGGRLQHAYTMPQPLQPRRFF